MSISASDLHRTKKPAPLPMFKIMIGLAACLASFQSAPWTQADPQHPENANIRADFKKALLERG
jgi:hypothetical protein